MTQSATERFETAVGRIILVRHGQTGWNEGVGERFRGRSEIDLDELGVRQAEATAPRITQWEVAAVYSSPLKRAMSTAQILADSLNIEPCPIDGLIDIDYGAWQGLSLEEAQADDSRLYSLWLESPHLATFPEGEALDQVRSRAVAAVDSILSSHPEQPVVLVSHKVVCKVLMCSFLGLELSQFWQVEQHTCAINEVEIGVPSPVVKLLNDTCHLRDM
jgi:broad specificity phosphatase PhoE